MAALVGGMLGKMVTWHHCTGIAGDGTPVVMERSGQVWSLAPRLPDSPYIAEVYWVIAERGGEEVESPVVMVAELATELGVWGRKWGIVPAVSGNDSCRPRWVSGLWVPELMDFQLRTRNRVSAQAWLQQIGTLA